MHAERTLSESPAPPGSARPTGWWIDALLLTGLVGLTVALANGLLLGLDVAVHRWATEHRPDLVYWTARALNYLGQGGWLLTPVATGLAILLARRTRSARPLLVVAAAFVLTYLTIGPAKLWTDRAAPRSELPTWYAVRIFNDLPSGEYDLSYPSGHVANAIVWYGAITLLLAALLRAYGRPSLSPTGYRVARFLPPAIVFTTTTYLSYHWVTDSVAGLLLGLLLGRLLGRLSWDRLPLPALPYDLHRPAGLSGPDRPE